MSEMKPGDYAAFPIQASDAQGSLYAEQGLTKREHIATQCLAAVVTAAGESEWSPEMAARKAVRLADELLIALEANPSEKS